MKKLATAGIACSLALMFLALTACANDPNRAEELRVRDGLPNLLAKLKAGKPVRIAYLGGSITAANGWRPKTLAWFKSQYPTADVIEINAAISGTGSDYGACRLAADVLAQNPDLVFMEHRVNGGGGAEYEAKSVEGIVRQIWQHNPQTDICLIYTISQSMLPTLQAGKQTRFGATMEAIADAYGIPSIDLGVEIAKREQAGTLVFRSDAPVPGKLVFAKDAAHPGDEGHEIYKDVIARSLLAMEGKGHLGAHQLPAPLEPRCWQTAELMPISQATLSAGWQPIDTASDPVYRESFHRTHAMLRGGVKCKQVGETVTVQWNGTTIGFSDIPHGKGMEVDVTIDGGKPITVKRPQRESTRHARFFYLPEQAPGKHTAVLRVSKLPADLSFYLGQILVIGTPLP